MGTKSGRCGIGDVCGRDNAKRAADTSAEELSDRLHFRVIEHTRGLISNVRTLANLTKDKWHTLSAQTFNVFTVDFLPVYSAVAELAESVINESIECVI